MTSQERHEGRYQRRKAQREATKAKRTNQIGGVENVFTFHQMFRDGKKCCNGVRWKTSTQNFEQHLFSGTAVRRRAVVTGRWRPKKYVRFRINERGKTRDIDAPHINDRQVHKTLSNGVLKPLYAPSMIYDNGASTKGKGLDFTFRRLKGHLRWWYRHYGREGYIILLDLKSFFPSAPHGTLMKRHERYIQDDRLRELADSVVRSVPGDKGMPLGVEPSQQEMVALPSTVDNFIKCQLGIKCAAHYMDDYYIMVETLEDAERVLDAVESHFFGIGLVVSKAKTKIQKLTKPFRFCKVKFHMTETGKIITHGCRDGMKRCKRKAKLFKAEYDDDKKTRRQAKDLIQCSIAYYSKYNDHGRVLRLHRLYYALFVKGSNHMQYIVTKRYKKKAADGKLRNLPWGTQCEQVGEFIRADDGSLLCAVTSQDAYEYFSRNDDGKGAERAELIREIKGLLAKRDAEYQDRWNRLWGAERFARFRRADYDDYWLWNHDFYNANVFDLQDILRTAKGA